MPVKKAAFKALKQDRAKAQRNKKVKSDLDALTRRLRKAIAAKDSNKAQGFLQQLIKKIDKSTQNGVVKKNTAARQKSRLTKAVNTLKKSS